jgi:nifR3 family TIM-barrel protein
MATSKVQTKFSKNVIARRRSRRSNPPDSPDFYVGDVPVYGDLILSPMDGFSDMPFRSLCRELGSAMSYTEFVNAMNVVQKRALHVNIERKLAYLPSERPVVYQLFDNHPDRLLEAALRLQERQPDIIDINMGCSVRSVSGRGAGAGLMRTPLKIARIFRKLSRGLDVPITGKIRLGWDEAVRNYLLVARIIEENGGSLVAVHARTREQGYGGQADWEAIAEVKAALSIPVIGNGDVRTVADIERLKAHTGCDGVMIGRGAIGNPWIFSRLDRAQVSQEQVQATMIRHLERMLEFYEDDHGLILFRKHASRYLSERRLTREQRLQLLEAARPAEFLRLLQAV